MDEVFIDANIFLEIFLGDVKSSQCKSFLSSLNEKKIKAVTTDFLIYSCLIIIQNNLKNSKFLKEAILFFNSYELTVIRPSLEDMHLAVDTMDALKLDFDDSLVVACIKNYGIGELATLDKHFDKIKGFRRSKI